MQLLPTAFLLAVALAPSAQAQGAAAPVAPRALLGQPPGAAAPAPGTAHAETPGTVVKEITVQAPRAPVSVDIDRRSYDITKDLQTESGSVADVLRNIPSVYVDLQGNVSIRGDSNVTIMVDGRPSSLFSGPSRGQTLQQLPASSYRSVEVMTNPSAAFRPDGSAGIINLVSKRPDRPGRSGSMRGSVSTTDGGQLGGNVSSVGKSFTITGEASWMREHLNTNVRDQRSVFDDMSGGYISSSQDSTRRQKVDVLSGRLAAEYRPDRKTTIAGELRATALWIQATNEARFDGLAPGAGAAVRFQGRGEEQNPVDDFTATASWRRKLGSDPGHELVVDITQEHKRDDRSREQIYLGTGPGAPNRAEQIDYNSGSDQTLLKIDYTRPFTSGARLKAGYELQYDSDNIDNFGLVGPQPGQLAPEPSLIDRFAFRQAINSAYVTYQDAWGALTVLGGLRAEATHIGLRDVATGFDGETDRAHLYPSLHLTWKKSSTEKLTASYSQRIQRPAPADYNPFRLYRDPYNFQAGNPGLVPLLTHHFEFAFERRRGTAQQIATFYWSENRGGVNTVITDLGGSIFLATKENLTRSVSTGLELVTAGKLGSKISYNVSGYGSWNEINSPQPGFDGRSAGWNFSGRGSLNWQPTPKDLIQVTGQLTGKILVPQGYHQPRGVLSVGYRRKLNTGWSAYVTGRDILNSNKDVLVIRSPGLTDRAQTLLSLRAIFVGVIYNFGSGPNRTDPGIDLGANLPAAASR